MDSQILWDNIEILKINQLTHKMRGNIPSSLWTILFGRMHKSLGAVRKCVFLKWGVLRCILGFFCDLAHTSSEVHPWELQQDPRPDPAGKVITENSRVNSHFHFNLLCAFQLSFLVFKKWHPGILGFVCLFPCFSKVLNVKPTFQFLTVNTAVYGHSGHSPPSLSSSYISQIIGKHLWVGH